MEGIRYANSTNKGQKIKPVFHVMATAGTGFICWFGPETFRMRLGDMMRNEIIDVFPLAN